MLESPLHPTVPGVSQLLDRCLLGLWTSLDGEELAWWVGEDGGEAGTEHLPRVCSPHPLPSLCL